MKYPDNVQELIALPIDYIGFIMYPKSGRYFLNPEDKDITPEQRSDILTDIPPTIKKTAVFVNEISSNIFFHAKHMRVHAVQLHGDESPFECKLIKQSLPGVEIIKAFNVSSPQDFKVTEYYEGIADYFLFDTKTPDYGGSGQKFDWRILDEYRGDTPFLLSGGISVDDAENIKAIKHPKLYGIDLNSKFEIKPGLKDVQLLQQFIKALKDEQD